MFAMYATTVTATNARSTIGVRPAKTYFVMTARNIPFASRVKKRIVLPVPRRSDVKNVEVACVVVVLSNAVNVKHLPAP